MSTSVFDFLVGESIWEPIKLTLITSAWCVKWQNPTIYLCVMHYFPMMFELDSNIL